MGNIAKTLASSRKATGIALVLAAILAISGMAFAVSSIGGATAADKGSGMSVPNISYLSPSAIKNNLAFAEVKNSNGTSLLFDPLGIDDPLGSDEPRIGLFFPGAPTEIDEAEIVYGAILSLDAVNPPEDLDGKIPSFKLSEDSQSIAQLLVTKHDDGNVTYGLKLTDVGDVTMEMEFTEPEDAYIPLEDIIEGYVLDEDTGILHDPETGYAYDESTGYLVDDEGNSYDLRTHWKVDPETGYLIDPETEEPVIPEPSDNEVYERTVHVGKHMLDTTLAVAEKIYDGTKAAEGTYILKPLAGDENSVRCILSDGMFDTPEVGENKHVEFRAELVGEKANVYTIPSGIVTSDDGIIVPAHLDWLEIDLPEQAATNNGTGYSELLLTQPPMLILDGPDGREVGPAPDSVYLEWYADPALTQKVDMTKRFSGAQGTVHTFYYKVCVADDMARNFVGERASSISVIMLDSILQNVSFTLPSSFVYGDEYQMSVTGASSDAQISFYSLNANATVSSNGVLKVTGVGAIDIIMSSHVNGSQDVEIEATSTAFPKQLSVTPQLSQRVFDGTDRAEATPLVEGIVNGDAEGDISISLVNGRFIGTDAADAGIGKQATFDVESLGGKAACYAVPGSVLGVGDVTRRSLGDMALSVDDRLLVSNGDSYAALPSSVIGNYAGRSYPVAITWYMDEECSIPSSPSDVFTGPKNTEFDIYCKLSPMSDTAINFDGEVIGHAVAVISDGDAIQPDFKITTQTYPIYGDNLELGYMGGADGAEVTFAVVSGNAHLLASGKTVRIDDLGTLVVTATCKADGYATKTDTISMGISKRKAMITVFARDKRYDGTSRALANPAIGHILEGDDVTFAVSGTFDDPAMGTDKPATFIVTATGSKRDYYEYPAVLASRADILPMRGCAIDTGFSDMVVENDSKAEWLPEEMTLDIPLYQAVTGSVRWYSDKAHEQEVTKDHVFSGARHDVEKLYYAVTFGSDAAGYVDGDKQGSIDVIINTEPKPAEIVISVPSRVTYGDTIALSAIGSNGELGSVEYSVRSGSGRIDNGSTLVVTGITPIVLEATSSADGYQGSKGSVIIEIDKKRLDVSVACDDKRYDGNDLATGSVRASGFAFDDADSIWLAAANGAFESPDAGTKSVTFDIVTTSGKASCYDYPKSVTATGTIR